jgi:hypothetical protein
MRVLASKLAQAFCLLVPTLALLVPADWAAAEPSEEQVAAIKSNCRSDFMSKCWGVPRGGAEAMQCLKKNMASLSAPCQQALKAVNAAPAKAPSAAPAAAAQPESAPATPAQPSPAAAAKTAAPAAPETPPSMQDSKPDAASAPASQPAPASPPMAAAKAPAKPSAPTHATTPQSPASSATQAKTEESAGVEKSGTGSSVKQPSAAPATSEETQPIIGFIPPRKKLMILRNCRQDLDTLCPDVSYGEGRQLRCLVSNRASLSPDCQGALAKLAR